MFRNPGIPIGKYFGIPVSIHPSWFIILVLLTYSWSTLPELEGVARPLALLLALLGAVTAFATLLAHEYGHALAARYFGIETERITLFLLGGVAQIKSEPRRPSEELVIALAGPAVSLVCMVFFAGLYFGLAAMGASDPTLFLFHYVALINFVFAAFNMIPGFPMDGGRVLRALIWMANGNFLKATFVASVCGRTFGFVLISFGVYLILGGAMGGLMLMLTGIFLNWLAKTAYQQAQLKAAFDHLFVKDLMRPVQVVVPADVSLRDVARDYIYRVHADRFPVVRGSSLLGYISADDVAAVDQTQWEGTKAERLAKPYMSQEILRPDQDAFAAFQRASQLGRRQLPVFSGRELIGFLFLQDVTNYMRTFMSAR